MDANEWLMQFNTAGTGLLDQPPLQTTPVSTNESYETLLNRYVKQEAKGISLSALPSEEPDKDKIGFWENIERGGWGGFFDRATLGIKPLVEAADLYSTVKRRQQNEYTTGPIGDRHRQEDQQKIIDYLEEQAEIQERGLTVGAKISNVVADMLPFMVEFIATGGVASIGKKAVTKGVLRMVERIAGKAAGKAIGRNITAKLAGWATAGAIRTALLPHRSILGYIENRMPDMQISQEGQIIFQEAGDKPFTAAYKAIGNQYIEMLSEEAGPALGRIASKVMPKSATKLIGGIRDAWMKGGAGRTAVQFGKKIMTRAGYNGILEEMGEERLGDLMRTVLNIDEHKGTGFSMFERIGKALYPGKEQLFIEAVAFLVPAAGQRVMISAKKRAIKSKLQQKLESQTTFSRKDVKELYGLERTTAEERQVIFDEQKQAMTETKASPYEKMSEAELAEAAKVEETVEPMASEAPFVRPLPKIGTKARAEIEKPLHSSETMQALDDIKAAFAPEKTAEKALAKRILRRNIAELAHKDAVNAKTFKKALRVMDNVNLEDGLEFMDRMERGVPQDDPRLNKITQKLFELQEDRLDKLQAIGKVPHVWENYLAHRFKDPAKARDVFSQIFGRRPLSGTKTYMKPRKLLNEQGKPLTYKEIYEKYGLEPIDRNPVRIVLANIHDIDRFLMKEDIVDQFKKNGLTEFVRERTKPPSTYAKVNDYVFTKYAQPEYTEKEAYDKYLYENLEAFARRLGVDVQTVATMRGENWGEAKGSTATRRFAGQMSTLAHEIGHIVGKRYGLYEWLTELGTHVQGRRHKYRGQWKESKADAKKKRVQIKNELKALSDLRYEGIEPSKHFKGYVRKKAEKEAVLFEALLHAPEKMEQIAPTVTKAFKQFLSDNSELKDFLNIKPSLVTGVGEIQKKREGTTILGHYYVPEPVAKLLNNYLSPGLRSSESKLIGTSYDYTRRLGNLLNQANLSFSLFHGINTTTDVMASTFGLGLRQILATPGQRLKGLKTILTTPISPLPNLWRGHQLLKEYHKDLDNIDDPKFREMMGAIITAGGRAGLDPFYYNQAVESFRRTIADIRKGTSEEQVKAMGKLPFKAISAGIEVAAHPVMQWLVPRQKMGLFALLAQHEMQRAREGRITDEQLAERLAQSWDNVDNRLGQLVYDNLFWNRKFKDFAMLMVRSVGWNLGSWREYGGAIGDILNMPTGKRQAQGDVWLSQKMAYTSGAIFTYMVLGSLIQNMLTGEDPEELRDYFFPKTGNLNPDGSDERLSLPTYAKDWFAYSKHPVKTIQHKLHPLWSDLSEMFQNEDFYGVEIRHPDDPLVRQTKDVCEYMAKCFLPFSVRNYQKMMLTGQPKWKAAAISASGIISAPASITRSPAQELMAKYNIEKLPRGSRTKEQFEKSQLRKQYRDKIKKGEPIDPAEVHTAFTIKEWRAVRKSAKIAPFAASFKRLAFSEALNVYTIANSEERRQVRSVLIGKYRRADKSKREYPDQRTLYRELIKG